MPTGRSAGRGSAAAGPSSSDRVVGATAPTDPRHRSGPSSSASAWKRLMWLTWWSSSVPSAAFRACYLHPTITLHSSPAATIPSPLLALPHPRNICLALHAAAIRIRQIQLLRLQSIWSLLKHPFHSDLPSHFPPQAITSKFCQPTSVNTQHPYPPASTPPIHSINSSHFPCHEYNEVGRRPAPAAAGPNRLAVPRQEAGQMLGKD